MDPNSPSADGTRGQVYVHGRPPASVRVAPCVMLLSHFSAAHVHADFKTALGGECRFHHVCVRGERGAESFEESFEVTRRGGG